MTRTFSVKRLSYRASLTVLVVLFASALASLGQVSRSLGTLPPGGTVTITFDVTINSPLSVASVTNQGNVSGTGFGPILTDDPALPGAADPTVTAITVAPQIACPANLYPSAATACSQPSVPFAATITAGIPTPTLTYQLGATVITSPYIFPVGTNTVTVTAANGTTPNAQCTFKVIVIPAAPTLSALRSSTNVILSWPTNFACYSLESTRALSNSIGTWTTIPGPFPFTGGTYYATNRITSTNQFYRLRH